MIYVKYISGDQDSRIQEEEKNVEIVALLLIALTAETPILPERTRSPHTKEPHDQRVQADPQSIA
jgi:hypothetical protein